MRGSPSFGHRPAAAGGVRPGPAPAQASGDLASVADHDDDVTTVIQREVAATSGSNAPHEDGAGADGATESVSAPSSASVDGPGDGMPTRVTESGITAGGITDEDRSGGDHPVDDDDPDDERGLDPTAERAVLLELLIYAWDRARSVGVWERLTAGLARIGVEVIRPDGDVFDPTSHEVGGVEKTSDPALHNRIAETESAGFRDRGRLIREPVVVVYRVS